MLHLILTTLVTTMIQATTLVALADNACQEALPVDRTLLPAKLVPALDKDAYLLRLLPSDETYWEVPIGLVVNRSGDACHPDGLPFTISLHSTTHPDDQKPTITHDFKNNKWTIKFTALAGAHVHVVKAGNDDGSAFKLYQIAYLGKVRGPTIR